MSTDLIKNPGFGVYNHDDSPPRARGVHGGCRLREESRCKQCGRSFLLYQRIVMDTCEAHKGLVAEEDV